MAEIPTVYRVYGLEDVLRSQKEIVQAFKEGKYSVKEFNQAQKENMEATRALNRAYSGMRMTQRAQTYEFRQAIQVMQSIGRIGDRLINLWQAYNVGMIRVERATRDVTDAKAELTKWQNLMNQYLHDFGEDSVYYLEAKDMVEQYQKAVEDAEAAQKQASQSMIGYWITLGPSIIGIVGDIAMVTLSIKMLGGTAGLIAALTKGFGSLGSAITAVFGSATLLAGTLSGLAVVAAFAIPIYLAFQKDADAAMKAQADWAISVEEHGKGAIQNINEIAEAWERMKVEAEAAGPIFEAVSGGGRWGRGGQFGIPSVPTEGYYYLHPKERVLTPGETRFYEAERKGMLTLPAGIREVNVTQHNVITKEVDFDTVGDRAYRRIIERLGGKW